MYKSKFFTILVIAFIVLGCTPKIASQTSGFITDQPLLTLDEINPERTISPHTTATSPITPEQARTSTHSPSATNTATLDLTNTLTPESILDASEVQIESITRLGRGVVKDVAWSPDDGTIAVAGHFGIDFYDADTLQLSRTLDMKSDVIQYSPDGKRMAFAYGSEIFLLDLVSGQVIRKFSSEISWFYQVAFNPEGNWLGAVGNRYECASPGADVFEIWDLDIGKLVSFGDIGSVDEFAFSPDGDSLAFDIYDAVWMVDPATGGFIKSFESLRHPFAFTPDWKSIVGVTDSNGIEVRDIETNQVLQSITTEEYYFYDDFILSPNGRLLIIPYVWARSKEDYETLTVDLQTGEINFGLNIDYFVSKAAFNSDGSRLAAVDWNNKKVDIWDLRDDTLVNSIEYSKAISDLAFLPISNGGSVINYRLAAAYENGSVWLWDVGNQLIIQRFEGHEDRVNMISIDVSGEFLASASNDYTARVWSITKGTELHTIEFDESYVQEAIFNPGDTQLLTNSDGLIQIWDTRSWDLLFEYARGWGLVQAQFLNNNQVIGFTYEPERFIRWDIHKDTLIATYTIEDDTLNRIYTGGVDSLGDIYSIAISADKQFFAVGTGMAKIYIWDLVSDKLSSKLEGHGWNLCEGFHEGVMDLAFDPVADILASAGYDGTVRLWNVKTGALLRIIEVPDDHLWSVAFSPDGRLLAAGGDNGFAYIWNVNFENQ